MQKAPTACESLLEKQSFIQHLTVNLWHPEDETLTLLPPDESQGLNWHYTDEWNLKGWRRKKDRAFNQSDFTFWTEYSSGTTANIEYVFPFPAIEKGELQVE